METCGILLLMSSSLSGNLSGLLLHMPINSRRMLVNSSVMSYNHLFVSVWNVLDLLVLFSKLVSKTKVCFQVLSKREIFIQVRFYLFQFSYSIFCFNLFWIYLFCYYVLYHLFYHCLGFHIIVVLSPRYVMVSEPRMVDVWV